jgi:hypothetical protein
MAGKGGWAIRLYKPGDFSKTIDIVSNFEGFHNRDLDDIVVFNSIYGLDSYLIWYIHPDLRGYDFDAVHFNLRLFPEMNKNKPFWENKYRVVEVKYDPIISKYVVFALSEDSVVLNTKLMSWRIPSTKFEEEREAWEVLEDVLEKNNILAVQFFESPNEELVDFRYKQVTLNPDWSVRDFINYICDDNKYEWYVYDKVLYVGRELKAIIKMNITSRYSDSGDRLSQSAFFKKLSGDLRPADVLGHLNKKWKCVWIKHWVGKTGGVTKGCFTRIGGGKPDKQLYQNTLEGIHEKDNAAYIFAHNQFNSYSVGIGNILKDEGETLYVDEVSVQKDTDTLKVRDPTEMVFDRGNEDDESRIVSQKERVARTTPYLDHNAGILFPSVKLDQPPPNSIIFNIKGREESSALGPFLMNNGKDLVIPLQDNKLDFRLQLPGGWCLYVDKDNMMVIEQNADPTTKPTGENVYIKIDSSGNIITKGTKTKLQEGTNTLAWKDHDHLGNPMTGNIGMPIIGSTAPNTKGTTDTLGD